MIKVIIYVFSNKSGTSRKNPPASAGDARVIGLIPGSGRSPGEENGTTLQYSCLENPTDRRTWWASAHGVTKSLQLCQPMPPQETLQHYRGVLVQSSVGSLLFCSGYWCGQGFVCALQDFPPVLWNPIVRSHWSSRSYSLDSQSLFRSLGFEA